MNDLEPHDLMLLNAAEGWLGLGNVIEADKELKQIPPCGTDEHEWGILIRLCKQGSLL
jgi:hypothetical protein